MTKRAHRRVNRESCPAFVNLEGEDWRAAPGYEGRYEVSNLGRVRSIFNKSKGVMRTPWPPKLIAQSYKTKPPYFTVFLVDEGGVQRHRKVHQLVLKAFVGPRPDGLNGCHLDDAPANNTLGNLYWGTHEENMIDRQRNGGTSRCGNRGAGR